MWTHHRQMLRLGLPTGLALTSALVSGAAGAELPWDEAKHNGAVSVRDRADPAFRPDGIRVGNYLFFPTAGYFLTYDSNVIGTPTGEVADFRHELDLTMRFESHLPRHLFDVALGASGVAYQEEADIDHINGFANARWRVDIDHAHTFTGLASTQLLHEESAGDETPLGAAEPVRVEKNNVEAAFNRDAGRLAASAGARFESWNYSDVSTVDGSTLDQDARDVWIASPFVDLAYRVSPGYRVTAEVIGHHQENVGDEVIDRDAEGYEALAGVEMELTRLVRASVKAGWRVQDYVQPGLVDISEPVWDMSVKWLALPSVTLSAEASRSIYATTYGESSGRLDSTYAGKIEYEMWRNLIITTDLEYRDSLYIGESRSDQLYAGRVTAEYAYTKNMLLLVKYEHEERVSSESDYSVTKDKLTIGGTLRF